MADTPDRFREAFARVDSSMSRPDAASRKDELKAEIIALYREVDAELLGLTALKDEIKGLVGKWKAIGGNGAEAPPAPGPPVPTSSRSDHLNASSHIEKGWSLMSLGEYAAAEETLRKATELVPDDTTATALLGWALMLQLKLDEALLLFQQVLQREPANALARVNVGYICLKKGIVGEAVEHLSRTIRLDNDRRATLYAHYYLGLLYFEREMYDDAETFLCKALALGPNLVEAYYELGRVRWFGGNPDAARKAWRDGVSANKFSPWGKRCAEMLERVESGEVLVR